LIGTKIASKLAGRLETFGKNNMKKDKKLLKLFNMFSDKKVGEDSQRGCKFFVGQNKGL